MIVSSIVFFGGCDDKLFDLSDEKTVTDTPPAQPVTDDTVVVKEYNGPGSKWELTLHDYGVFTLKEDESIGISMSGTHTALTSGFTKLKVTTSTNPSLSSSEAYMLEVPGLLTIMQPLINDVNYSQLIAMIPSGACQSGNINNNWIDIKRDINSSSSAVFGTFNFLDGNGSASLNKRFNLISADLGEANLSTLECNQGLANLTDGRAYMHTSGNSIIHTGLSTPSDDSDDSFMLSIPAKSINSISALSDEYIGFVYDSTLKSIQPVNMALSEVGIGVGYIYTDVGNEVLDTNNSINIVVNQVNRPLDGFVNLGINGAQSRCIADSNLSGSGRKVMMCTGDNPSQAGVGHIYTMLLVSK